MRKFLIAIAVMMVSLPSMAQFIRGSVKKNIDPTKIDIVFQPTYSSIAGEYVNYFQFSVAIPLAGNAGVTATALAVNAFQNMGTLTASGPFVEGSELVFNFGYLNPSPPPTNFYVWTANTDFTGVVITFSTANAALVGKMVDMANSDFGFGGANGNSLYGIVTNTGDKTDFATLFYAIPGQSQLGFTPNPGTGIDDQYVETIAAPACNAGTVSGTSPLCIGQSATYSSNGDAGGLWSSSNTGVATVNATSGLVTAVSAGTTTITYTVSTGCPSPVSASKILTVSSNANAGTVSGTSPLCIGQSATYSSNGDAGGTWSSSNTGVATVNATSGVVTAVGAGTTSITYTVSGCNGPASSSQTLTVNPNANAGTVTGTSPLCIGQSATYSSTGDAGGTWSSSNTGVATVNATSGVVTAVGAGTTNITYTVSTGCNSPVSASQALTVNPNANAGTVTGTSPLCIGASATYSSNGDAGGTWSSSNTGVATVNATSGVVTAVGAGSTVITYTVSTGCNSPVSASQSLTVNPNANAGTVTGTSPLCIGQSATYSSNGDAGGTWSSSNTSVATVNATSGVVTAVGAGSTVITYTVSTGCNSPVSASQALTVNANANAGTVSGTSPLCIGQSATYSSNGDAGGTWSSSNTGVATVNATSGLVTALSAGSTIITYTVSTGCNSPVSASKTLTVNPNANAGTVSGPSPLCIEEGFVIYSSTGDAGGTWSSSNTSVATVNATSGVVSPVGPGSTIITYTISTGCNSPVSASQALTVNANVNAGTISGPSPLCIGATATYTSDGDAGGTWSSSNTGVATVNATSGLVTALSAGSTIINYTVSGCGGPVTSSKTLTVNPNANAGTVSGTSPLCIGQSATYSSNGDAGGTWSSSNTGVATVNATSGVVTAVGAGSTIITYTVSTGCNSPVSASQTLTVDPNANAGTVTGTSPLCIGQSATYSSNGDAGGTWSSSNTGVATVNATSGVVTAVGAGTTNITYTVSTGCNSPVSASQALTVDPNANAGTVSGATPLCIGQSATYSSNGDAGGTWSSSNTGVATVNATSGVVTAVGAGSTIITYTVSTGCNSPVSASQTLTVDPNANAGTVSGVSPLCIGQSATYSSTGDAGGTWSSSNTGVATVNATSGVVTAVGAGSTVITYTVSTGCNSPVSASQALTVNANANAGTVSGATPLCIGQSATYSSNGDAGGTWSSSNTGVATVNATSGVVTAVGAGSTVITYTVSTGCNSPVSASQTLTVGQDANAGTVTGTSPLCIGQSATYSSNGDAGGTWSSSNTGVATVNATSGVVTAVGAGTTNITYTVSTGCNSPVSASQALTVDPNANAGTVSGASPLCIGQSATYSSTGDAGGTWSSSNTGVATVNATSGVVTAVGAGTTNITYTVSTGCNSPVSASQALTVDPNANAGTVSGASPLCIGQSATYSSNGDAGGTWSSSNTGVATVNATSGVVTAVGAGSTIITYTVSTGCNSPVSASQTLTVDPNANAGTVSGVSPLCIGQSATYSSTGDAGGTWSSSNTGVATVNATSGVVTAVGAGSTVITYTVSTGCNSPVSASQALTVNANANAGTVSGATPLCIGQTATYSSNGDAGGTWSSSNTGVATVNATSGVVTAVGAGTTNITYTVSTGCNSPVSASQALTVNPNANAGTVSGATPLCIGQSATYSSNGDAGGTWSSSNTGVATVNATSGVVTAVGAGSTVITYTVSTGCNSPVSASQSLTVNPNANAGTVTGTSPLCIGQSATYSSTGDAGGTWSSSNTSVATVNATSGVVTAVGAGTTNITYTVSTGCNSPVSASQALTVDPNANAGTVSGVSPLCIGQSATYSSTGDAGGTWSSSNTSVATVNATSGVVTAVGAGTTNITYTVSTGCNSPVSASQALTVNPNANAGTVSGTSPLCIGQTATYTSNGDAGGTWSSSNTGVATVHATSGLVTAVGAGSTVITYTVSTGCNGPVSASQTLTVDPDANAGTVTGTSPLCIGQSATYSSNGDAGGTWSSSNTSVASVNTTSGVVMALSAGTTVITYTVSTGCNSPVSASKTLTVNNNANAGSVSGTSPLCIGQTAIYTSNGDPGVWSSSNTFVATVNASSGLVTAVSAGTTNIIYTVSTGCNAPVSSFKTLTVSPNANAGRVNGPSPLCIGATGTYTSDGDAGGTWSSSNPAVASVNPLSGLVTALSAGTANIIYTVNTGCNSPVSSSATLTVSPNGNAGTVSGATPLCIGATATYTSNGNTGGSWSSSNTAVATVNATSGLVTAVAAGTADITYTVTACGPVSTASKTVTVNPNVSAGTVSGTSPLCIGATDTYTSNGNAGGTWSSSNTSVATVNASSGLVTAVSTGTANIIYTVTVGCGSPVSASKTLTVSANANAGTVSGASPLCLGATATYTSNGDAGGNWSSSNTAVASVNPLSGLVTALSAGTTNITYTVSTGCNAPFSSSKTLTVNDPPVISSPNVTQPTCSTPSGTIVVNATGSGTLEYSLNGGAYQLSNTFSGLAAGNYNIAARLQSTPNCSSNYSGNPVVINTVPVTPTVDPVPNQVVVNGDNTAAVTFTGSVPGTVYNWTNDNTSIGLAAGGTGDIASFTAINNSNAVVTATVTVTPSYTNAGGTCTGPTTSFTYYVNPTPVYIHGSVKRNANPTKIDVVFKPTYSSEPGEYVNYFQFSVAIPLAGNAGVTATATGVNAFQNMGTLLLDGPYVEGSELVFNFGYLNPNAPAVNHFAWTNGVEFTGVEVTFSTSASTQFTRMSDFTNNENGPGGINGNTLFGIVTNTGDKTDFSNFFYAIPGESITGNYPVSNDQYVQVISCNGAVGGTASGDATFCVSGTPSITATGYSTGPGTGYQWQYSNDNFVTNINDFVGQTNPASLITGVVSSTTYYRLKVSCPFGIATAYSNVVTVTILPVVNAGTVSGTSPLCIGQSATYSSTGDAGGTWSSSNPAVATVNATSGVVTALSAGSTIITYTVSGCGGPASSSQALTVDPNANAGTVSGTSPLCIGQTATYTSNGDAGGTWSSSNTGVATVNATSGVVTAVGAGSTNITYTVGGCNGPVTASQSLTVNQDANAGTVSGVSPLCIGQSATYTSNGDAGGTWSSSNPAVATVDGSGMVTALSAGTTTITYTVSTGCNSPVSASQSLTVNPNANAGTVSGTSPLCIGQSATYSSTGDAGGTWSSSNPAVATVNAASGVVTAVGAGSTIITYTVSGCNGPASASQSLTVDPNANAGTVSGTSPLCIGQTATYTSNGDAGGTWSSSNMSVATVDGSGMVTALSAGTTTITYTVSTGCNSPVSASQSLTVNPDANAGTVSGVSPLCIGQTATYTSNGDAGGTWSSSNTGVATVNATSGLVTALSAGTTTITYTVSTGCNSPVSASQSLTVNADANAGTVSGVSPLCIGQTATYTSNGDASGTWSSSNMSVATVNATSGVVTAVGAGSTIITYTVSGCNGPASSSQSLTVNPNVSAGTVSGATPICIGETTTYTASGTTGGTWSSSNTSVATVNATSGAVTGVAAGTSTITYTVSGCGPVSSASKLVTVSPSVVAPSAINGATPLCAGATATYTQTGGTAGGTWSSTNTSVATVNASTGFVTAVAAGTTDITYTVNGCGGPVSNFKTLTVVGPYTITASAGPNGSITPSGSVTVPCNGRQTFTMTANSCYHIATVLVDGVNDPAAVVSGSYTFDNVTADHTISVTFALSGPYNIVASAGPNGTIVPSGTTVVTCGGSQAYTMTANAGYHINQVLVDGVNNPAAVSSGTYTFTNVQSDHTISVSFASACTPTTVTISANSNAFCGNLTLTAVPAIPGSYTYQWYRNAVLIAGATAQTYPLTTASPDGNYTVTLSQGVSCTSAPSPAYVYNKQNTLQSYTILGLDNVELGENNTVLRGSVGNTKSGNQVYIKKNGWVASPGAFVKASKITVDNPSNVPTRILSRVTVTLPTMLYNTTSTSGLSNITISSNQTLNGNWKDVTIKKNVVVTLNGTIFGNIRIEDGAQVTFSAAVINIYSLNVGTNSGAGNITRVKFSTDCIVKVKDEVKIDENCRINSTSKRVVFYVDEDIEVEGKNTHVRVSIYAPNDDIKVIGDYSVNCYMTGRFIAKEIKSEGKNVIWDYFDCANPPAANLTEEPPVDITTTPQPELPGKYPVEIAEKLDVRAYPNPSAHRFTLMLKNTQMNQQVLVRVLDINGKVRQELRGNPGQVFQVGEALLPGIYIAEVIQGTEKVTVKLIKQ